MRDHRARSSAVLAALVVVSSLTLGGTAAVTMTPAAEATGVTEAMTATPLSGQLRPHPARWRRVMDENFSGSALNLDRWGRCHWWSRVGCTIATNDELEWYRPENVSVTGGRLRLEAREGDYTNGNGDTYPYTSGMISSGPPRHRARPRAGFTYGYIEARLRLPHGRGLWPAFWLLPGTSESRPEVDILETLGQTPDRARFHYHYLDRHNTRRSLGEDWVNDSLADGGWHRFAVDWRPGSLTWIVDGRARWRVRGSSVPDEPLYIVLNLAVGGVYPGPPDDSTSFPAAVEADWIRVWQPRSPS